MVVCDLMFTKDDGDIDSAQPHGIHCCVTQKLKLMYTVMHEYVIPSVFILNNYQNAIQDCLL